VDVLALLLVIGLVVGALFALRIVLAWAIVIVPPLCGLALGIWVWAMGHDNIGVLIIIGTFIAGYGWVEWAIEFVDKHDIMPGD